MPPTRPRRIRLQSLHDENRDDKACEADQRFAVSTHEDRVDDSFNK